MNCKKGHNSRDMGTETDRQTDRRTRGQEIMCDACEYNINDTKHASLPDC